MKKRGRDKGTGGGGKKGLVELFWVYYQVLE